MSHRQERPGPNDSPDKHLLPAGIRHVPPRGVPGSPTQDESLGRPWQQREQHVRFFDGSGASDGLDIAPPPPHTRPVRPKQYSYESTSTAPGYPPPLSGYPGPQPSLRRAVPSGFEAYLSSGEPAPKWHKGWRPKRHQGSGDDYKSHASRRSRSHSRSRSRSPEMIIKSEVYSDPESLDDLPPPPELSGRGPRPPTSPTRPARSAAVSGYDSSENSEGSILSSSTVYEYGNYDGADRVYEFNPSHLSRKVSQDASTILSGSSGDVSAAGGGEKGPSGPDSGSNIVRPSHIYQSEYTGDGFLAGSHSAKLTAILDSKRQRQPLFRWRHITQSTMSFEGLSEEVGHITGLSDSDKHSLVRLLSDVKKYAIKTTPTSTGSNVRHMEPGFLQIKSDGPNAAKEKITPTNTVTWLCMPYFSLQKYAGPLSNATPGSFPTRTLLQEQYSGVSRERDLQQVVCQLGHVPPDMCFHISQLWCIVLALLITCGTMTETALRGDVVDLVTEPSRDPSSPGTPSFLYVYYTEAVLYALPLEECRTWFAFVSHFHDFWPQTLKFTHRDRLVTASDWPAIFNLARLSSSRVVLSVKPGKPPPPPPRGILKTAIKQDGNVADENQDGPQAKLKLPTKGKENAVKFDVPETEATDDKFHVFSWLDSFTVTEEASSKEQAESLRVQLQEMDEFIRKETNASDRKAYQNCPEATRLDALTSLEEQLEKSKKSPQSKREFDDRVDIVNAAEIIFRFFLPLQFEGPTVGKFWGAIHRLIRKIPKTSKLQGRRGEVTVIVSRRSHYESGIPDTRTHLRELTQAIQSFTNIIAHAQPLERAMIAVPIQLIRAWVHLIMALIKANNMMKSWSLHMDLVQTLIKEGMVEVMQALPAEDLLSKEVVLPMEIVSLLCLKLLEDSTGTFPDLDMTYTEYINALDNEVATKPSQRSFEHRINLLKQETTVILKTVNKQKRIFTSLAIDNRSRTQPIHNPFTNFAAANPFAPQATAPKRRTMEVDDYYTGAAQQGHGREMNRHGSTHRFQSVEPLRHAASRPPTVYNTYHAGEPGTPAPLPTYDWAKPPQEYYRLSPTHPGGFRDLLAVDCVALIERRFASFQELYPYADYLQKYNENKWEDTKDRQEQAIYAFTIVTVIFLPLSAVAGIFGMNTADVRGMDFDQWLYWATAVPVTLGVILVGLWWMGEIGNAFSWLPWVRKEDAAYGTFRSQKRTKKGVSPQTVVPNMRVQRAEEEISPPGTPPPRRTQPIMRYAGGYDPEGLRQRRPEGYDYRV